ncbi:hypothetical protein [Clostridium sp.]|uniref:hypothetical protein n=1 Tax=Clostridium sp. TaxID=1506 RepID=UPI003F2B4A1F
MLEEKNINEELVDLENETKTEEIILETEDTLYEENLNDEIKVEEVTKPSFFKRLLTAGIDQMVVIASSLIGLLLFDLILRLFGFYIVERQPMFLIVYIIMNVIYGPICESLKSQKTLGRIIVK